MKRTLLALSLLGPFLAEDARACGDAELQAFIASAQALAADAAAKGERLLPCPQERDEAVQWLAFARSLANDAAGAARAELSPVRPAPRTDRDKVLAKAKTGDYGELLQKVDAREPNYATAADAQVTLARALARRRNFERGRTAYVDALRVNPSDARAEAEYLYTYIWEGRYTEADEKLAAVRGGDVPAYLRDAVQRGRALAQRLMPKDAPRAGAAPRASLPIQLAARGLGDTDAVIAGTPGVGLYASRHELRNLYERTSATAVYEGAVTARLAAHDMRTKTLGADAARATELRVGASRALSETFGVRGEAGYFSPGSTNVFGHAHIVAGPPSVFEVYAGAARAPLALDLPLTLDDLGLMRDALQLGGRYKRYVEAALEVLKEGKYSPYERHRILGRIPLAGDQGSDEHLDLRIPFTLERHPRPSPHYNADPRTVTAGAGAEYGATLGGGWLVALAADYTLSFTQMRDPATSTRRAGAFAVDARAAASISDQTLVSLSGTYYRAANESDLSSVDRLNALTLGVVWQPGKL